MSKPTASPTHLLRGLIVAGDVTRQHHLSNPLPTQVGQPEAISLTIDRSFGGAVQLARMIQGFLDVEDRNSGIKPTEDQVRDRSLTGEHHLWKYVFNKKKERLLAYDRFLGYDRPDKGQPNHPGAVVLTQPPPNPQVSHGSIVVLDDCNINFRSIETGWPPQLKHLSPQADLIVMKTTHPFDAENRLFSHCVQLHADKLMVVCSDDDLRKMDVQLTKNLAWETTLDDLLKALQTNSRLDLLRQCRWLVLPIGLAGVVVVQNPRDNTENRKVRVIDPRYLSTPAWDSVASPELARLHCAWLTASIAAYFASCSDVELRDLKRGVAIGEAKTGLTEFLHKALWQIRHFSEQAMIDDRHVVGIRSLFVDQDRFSEEQEAESADSRTKKEDPWKKFEDNKANLDLLTFLIEHEMPGREQGGEKVERPYAGSRIKVSVYDKRERAFELVCRAPPEKWTFLPQDNDTNDDANALKQLARRIAEEGPNAALGKVPHEEFSEKLVTADPDEIGRFRTILRVLREYKKLDRPQRPLCLAVFGSPGTGKSFVIQEIAKKVFGDSTKFLTFNLSQFSKPTDLIGALHQVRDAVLKDKNPPVVFWDEFDSRLGDAELGWLRYFLAPMQDGNFQEDQITHSIGKAVFVFAGGIYKKWLDLEQRQDHTKERGTLHPVGQTESGGAAETERNPTKRPQMAAPTKFQDGDIRNDEQKWKASKAPDFKSRLQGHLDILNPNGEVDLNECDDLDQAGKHGTVERFPKHYVRRAFLLRHALREREPRLFQGDHLQIEYGVLDALLFNPKYQFGARSIGAILAMCELGGKTSFTRSDLPPDPQLAMHVDDVDDFREPLSNSQ